MLREHPHFGLPAVTGVRRREVPQVKTGNPMLALWLAHVAPDAALVGLVLLINWELLQPLRRFTLNDRVNVAPRSVRVCLNVLAQLRAG